MTATTNTTQSLDATLREAYRTHDANLLAGLYADDARVEIIDAGSPPSTPRRLEGKAAIETHLREVLARPMRHEVEIVAPSGDALGYLVRCRYPDGGRVVCSSLARLRDGRIAHEVGVQVWDA